MCSFLVIALFPAFQDGTSETSHETRDTPLMKRGYSLLEYSWSAAFSWPQTLPWATKTYCLVGSLYVPGFTMRTYLKQKQENVAVSLIYASTP